MHGAIIVNFQPHIYFNPTNLSVVKIGLGCELKVKSGYFKCMDMMARDQGMLVRL